MMLTFLQSNYGYSGADQALAAGFGFGTVIFGLLLYLFYAYCLYKIFQKAGVENPWMAFIPVIMYLPLMQMAKKPMWWIILLFIPLVNIIIMVIVWLRVARAFGKSDLYGIAMILFGFIMLPVLAFSDAQYNPNAIPDDTNKNF